MGNLLNFLREAEANKKVEKIQIFGQKEAFYRGNEFAYPHCNKSSQQCNSYEVSCHVNEDNIPCDTVI